MDSRHYSTRALYRRLLLVARPVWPRLCGVFLLTLLSAPIALLTPIPLKMAVDSAIGTAPLPRWVDAVLPASIARSPTGIVWVAAILVLMIGLIGRLQEVVAATAQTATAERVTLALKTAIFRHAQRLSLAYHDTRGTADSAYRLMHDAPALQYIVVEGLVPFATATATLVAIVWVTLRLDWQLALVALGVSPILVLLSRTYRRRMRAQAREVKRLEAGALAIAQEVLGALRVVKAFGQEERETNRFGGQSLKGSAARIRAAFLESVFGGLLGLATAGGTAITLLIGVAHVRAGSLTLGELLLVMAYLAQLYGPLTMISRKAASIQTHLASMDRAFALLDQPPDVPENPAARPLVRAAGAVSFRDVSFAYGPDRQILHRVSFDIAPGTCLGITGATGAGKTTLMNLLCRFYDVTDGQVLLDGVDIRDYQLAALRAQFAIVLQDPLLFSTTIAENIAYAGPAPEEQIMAAAKAANIHEFIAGLPQGYQTPVGERGMRLSGGERQRIALARAFLKDAPILILDEPTSSVDTATEGLIIDAMERLMRKRTTIMIAHRLKTLEHCDMRLNLDDGRVTESSTRFLAAVAGVSGARTPNV